MLYQIILLFHTLAAICIVALVLVQQGKGATVGAAFGSGASQTVFGSRGSGSFLFRVTMGFMVLFFITSISLNYVATYTYKQQRVITLPAGQNSGKVPLPNKSMNNKPAGQEDRVLPTIPAVPTEKSAASK